jgi:hypothetical protein
MTADELAWWRAGAIEATGDPANLRPCVDCTRAFATAARAVGVCNGTPGEPRADG